MDISLYWATEFSLLLKRLAPLWLFVAWLHWSWKGNRLHHPRARHWFYCLAFKALSDLLHCLSIFSIFWGFLYRYNTQIWENTPLGASLIAKTLEVFLIYCFWVSFYISRAIFSNLNPKNLGFLWPQQLPWSLTSWQGFSAHLQGFVHWFALDLCCMHLVFYISCVYLYFHSFLTSFYVFVLQVITILWSPKASVGFCGCLTLDWKSNDLPPWGLTLQS